MRPSARRRSQRGIARSEAPCAESNSQWAKDAGAPFINADYIGDELNRNTCLLRIAKIRKAVSVPTGAKLMEFGDTGLRLSCQVRQRLPPLGTIPKTAQRKPESRSACLVKSYTQNGHAEWSGHQQSHRCALVRLPVQRAKIETCAFIPGCKKWTKRHI